MRPERAGGLAPSRAAAATLGALSLGIVGFGLLALSDSSQTRGEPLYGGRRHMPRGTDAEPSSIGPGRNLNLAAGTLALSVLLDSALEHYRGGFRNPVMYVPLAVASATLVTSLHAVASRRSGGRAARDPVYVVAALTGVVGTGFHVYNVLKRPGGLAWQNLFYGAPLGAPMAILLAGLLGRAAERVRDCHPGSAPKLLGLPAGRTVAAVGSIGILGTVGEAGLLHFRGAFHNPAMFLPVTVPPVAAGLLAHAALGPTGRQCTFTTRWLQLTAILGFAGVGFHCCGVARNMGGWRNWRQNLLAGPPLPAPPAFTGLALAGLSALRLLEEERGHA
ncbi:MAG: hypothetical protein U1E45_22735 [Geminicoccaceae bacterium]